jgi:hypothetical protein
VNVFRMETSAHVSASPVFIDSTESINLLRLSSVGVGVEIASVHTAAGKESDCLRRYGAMVEESRPAGWGQMGTFFGLRPLPWATLFGPIYTRHFGIDRIRSAPAHRIDEVDDGRIIIRLTPSLHDLEENWDAFNEVRERVMDHLGRESFQRPRNSADDRPLPDWKDYRGGWPAERIPEEFIPLRDELIREHAGPPGGIIPAPVGSLEEALRQPHRFKVWEIPAGGRKTRLAVTDKYREEEISFPDDATRKKFADELRSAGARFTRLYAAGREAKR